MEIAFPKKKLLAWINEVLDADTTYFAQRKSLWETLKEIKVSRPTGKTASGELAIKLSEFQALKDYLMARNEGLNDNQRLVFNVTINRIASALAQETASKQQISILKTDLEPGQLTEEQVLLSLDKPQRVEVLEQKESKEQKERKAVQAQATPLKQSTQTPSLLSLLTNTSQTLQPPRQQQQQQQSQSATAAEAKQREAEGDDV